MTLHEDHWLGARLRGSQIGENGIEEDGFGDVIWALALNTGSFLALCALAPLILVVSSYGEDEQILQQLPTPPPDDKVDVGVVPGENAPGGYTGELTAASETLEGSSFRLNLQQPIPPDFRGPYQRKALVVGELLDEGGDGFCPQGTS